jgi:PiT family inorganic phosphate transporter
VGNILDELGTGSFMLLCIGILLALAFEFVNGFHDTANAVATVIYTNTLRARWAVLLSGVCNFTGVFLGGIAVAVGIINLLPVDLLVQAGTGAGFAMVIALLFAAVAWNLGTWYFGLPTSSSHTLIGSILGIGIANALLSGHSLATGVNWSKAREIGLSLLVSPLLGLVCAATLFMLLKRYVKSPSLLTPPKEGVPPPRGTRALLILTCSGVSLAHGSNDGQKGVGIIVLILIALAPGFFALDAHAPADAMTATKAAIASITKTLDADADKTAAIEVAAVKQELAAIDVRLAAASTSADVPAKERFAARRAILLADHGLSALLASGNLHLSQAQQHQLTRDRKALRGLSDYAPWWVLVAVATALGIGTTVGWKRIVVTVGEKIGKTHLTYGQGAAAELVAMCTIGLSAWLGLPVSTTHVLSSGVAGTMIAHGSGLQRRTVTAIGLAWVLTLPASVALSAGSFVLLRSMLA